MDKVYYESDVDEWVEENGEEDALALFNEMLPKMKGKLNRLDKRIETVLAEIKQVFPDAQYYTASGGFNLVLGATHAGRGESPQQQRIAWEGIHASIGDGDW